MSAFAPVVTTTQTIGDGLVVRWYRHESAVDAGQPILSASRNAVIVSATLTGEAEVSEVCQLLGSAMFVMQELKADRREGILRLATHYRSGFFAPLRRVEVTP